MLYRTVGIYRLSPSNRVWPWWSFAHRNPGFVSRCATLLRLLICDRQLAYTYHTDGPVRTCQLCTRMTRLDTTHILMECESVLDIRTQLWDRIRQSAPPALFKEMNRMDNRSKTAFMLSGFHGVSYCSEWDRLYIDVCIFCTDICKKFNRMCNDE